MLAPQFLLPIAHAARLLREVAQQVRQSETSPPHYEWSAVGDETAVAAHDKYMDAAQELEAWERAIGAGVASGQLVSKPDELPEPWGHCVEGRVFVGRLPAHVKTLAETEDWIPTKLYTERQLRMPAQCLQQSGPATDTRFNLGWVAGWAAHARAYPLQQSEPAAAITALWEAIGYQCAQAVETGNLAPSQKLIDAMAAVEGPQQSERAPLSDAQIDQIHSDNYEAYERGDVEYESRGLARAIEAAHGIKAAGAQP